MAILERSKPVMPADGFAKERCRLVLLSKIADLGGKITPRANPQALNGYEFSEFGAESENELRFLASRNYLEARFFERLNTCPKCASHHLNIREVCPGCRHAYLKEETLLHHYRCGYVGRASEFCIGADHNGGLVCPKCNRRLNHLGTEYDRIGTVSCCLQCGLSFQVPPVEAVCLTCDTHTPASELSNVDIFSYALTSLGAAAVRRGKLLEDEEELLFISDVPVYRPVVMIELLKREAKRARHFKSQFSLLLVHPTIDWKGDSRTESEQAFLKQLCGFLREVDTIGQLSTASFVVMMAESKKADAELLRQCMLSDPSLSPQVEIHVVEISGLADAHDRIRADQFERLLAGQRGKE